MIASLNFMIITHLLGQKKMNLLKDGSRKIVIVLANVESEELKEKDPMKHKLENKYFLGNWNNGAPEGRGIVYEPGIVLYDGLFKNG